MSVRVKGEEHHITLCCATWGCASSNCWGGEVGGAGSWDPDKPSAAEGTGLCALPAALSPSVLCPGQSSGCSSLGTLCQSPGLKWNVGVFAPQLFSGGFLWTSGRQLNNWVVNVNRLLKSELESIHSLKDFNKGKGIASQESWAGWHRKLSVATLLSALSFVFSAYGKYSSHKSSTLTLMQMHEMVELARDPHSPDNVSTVR